MRKYTKTPIFVTAAWAPPPATPPVTRLQAELRNHSMSALRASPYNTSSNILYYTFEHSKPHKCGSSSKATVTDK